MISLFFVGAYMMQNFIVNSIDYLVFKQAMGYYNDELFLQMFSYKLFQAAICLVLGFVYAETIKPSIPFITEHPAIIVTIFKWTIPLSICMLGSFLIELTFYNHHQRSKVFKTELTKVFSTVVSVYLIAIIYSNWIQSLASYTQKTKQQWLKYVKQYRSIQEEYAEKQNEAQMRLHMRRLQTPTVKIT